MKNAKILLLLFICLLLFPLNIKAKEKVEVHLFYGDDCPFCKKEMSFLEELTNNYDNVVISKYEISGSTKKVELFNKVRKAFNIDQTYIPLTIIGTNHYIGFNSDVERKVEKTIEYYSTKKHQNLVSEIMTNKFDPNLDKIEENNIENSLIEIPFLGLVDVKKVSIPILALIIGLVDGFNPCAMWVLLLLISMLLGMENKRRRWILGLTFVGTSALVYLLLMASWLKITISIMSISWVKILIGIVAIIGGVINLKSFRKGLKEEDGCTVVEEKKRNKIIERIKKITTQQNFAFAIIGIMALAVSVNLIELACSAGLPILFTQILAMNPLTKFQHFIYLLIYIFFFLIDDIVILIIAMISFELIGISTKYSKYSHLVGGLIMLILGVLLIFKPELLSFTI